MGASVSDVLLQLEGVAAFLFPLLLGALGWTWLRSRPAGSPSAKASGVLLYLLFAPALFGLIPGHLRWMHALPLEGLTGRLVVDTLVHYLNFPGAAIVIVSMVVIALYLSTTFSFSTAQQWLAIRFAFVLCLAGPYTQLAYRLGEEARRKRRHCKRWPRRPAQRVGGEGAGFPLHGTPPLLM